MRKPIVAGNWKMHGSRASVAALLELLVEARHVSSVIFPPFVFLEQIQRTLQDFPILCGAQNVSHEPAGAFTGEISAAMLLDFGCRYALVGHSERRTLYGENDEIVAKKWVSAYKAGLIPMLCVGETKEEREQNLTTEVITRQLSAVLNTQEGMKNLTSDAIIAYEPVWAIGTGLTASPLQAQEIHAIIRAHIAQQNAELAGKIRILYGGSVKAANAPQLAEMPDIDGALVGGASLDAAEFIAICEGFKCNNLS